MSFYCQKEWPHLRSIIAADKPAWSALKPLTDAGCGFSGEPLLGQRKKPLGTVLTIADETDVKQLEDNARRSQQLASLGEMAAGIYHEIRNPLTCLRGCAPEIQETSAGSNEDQSALAKKIVVNESDRLARLAEDFLGAARLRENNLRIYPHRFFFRTSDFVPEATGSS